MKSFSSNVDCNPTVYYAQCTNNDMFNITYVVKILKKVINYTRKLLKSLYKLIKTEKYLQHYTKNLSME